MSAVQPWRQLAILSSFNINSIENNPFSHVTTPPLSSLPTDTSCAGSEGIHVSLFCGAGKSYCCTSCSSRGDFFSPSILPTCLVSRRWMHLHLAKLPVSSSWRRSFIHGVCASWWLFLRVSPLPQHTHPTICRRDLAQCQREGATFFWGHLNMNFRNSKLQVIRF